MIAFNEVLTEDRTVYKNERDVMAISILFLKACHKSSF